MHADRKISCSIDIVLKLQGDAIKISKSSGNIRIGGKILACKLGTLVDQCVQCILVDDCGQKIALFAIYFCCFRCKLKGKAPVCVIGYIERVGQIDQLAVIDAAVGCVLPLAFTGSGVF